MTTAVVVGSGPNGLAAALTLAAEGVEVRVLEADERLGGGTRSSELTLPGLVHDECSAAHPLAVDSPFARRFDLTAHGLTWRWPEVEYSHPLEHGDGAAAYRSVEQTAAGLGSDSRRWAAVFGPVSKGFADLEEDFLKPILRVPSHPVKLLRFGMRAMLPAAALARLFGTPAARSLWAGVAAHAFRPFGVPMSSAVGVTLGSAAHRYGWPVAQGGSQAISRAMIALLERLGAHLETGREVKSLHELGRPDIIMLDVAPEAAVRIAGDRMPRRIARAFRRFKHAPAAFKVDFAVEGGIPWQHEPSRRAGTVHVGGTFAEIAAAEHDVHRGRMPDRPFVLLCQQYVADESRASGGICPVYSYAHVPAGWPGDATAQIERQIERFAPGFRDRIVARHVRDVRDMERHNANYVRGDIITGANSPLQMFGRPRLARDPYATGIPGVYICSAATPPGAGAHGMCGYNAALAALKTLPA